MVQNFLAVKKKAARNAKVLLAVSCQTKSKPHWFSTSLCKQPQLIWNQTDKDVLLEPVGFAEGKSHPALAHSHALQPAQLFQSHNQAHTHTQMPSLPLGCLVTGFYKILVAHQLPPGKKKPHPELSKGNSHMGLALFEGGFAFVFKEEGDWSGKLGKSNFKL